MLKFFQVERHYQKTVVRLYVEPAECTAELTVTYDRRIVGRETLGTDQHGAKFGRDTWFDLRDPAAAESFLCRDMGEQGNFVESMDWQGRHGLFNRAA